ncbi:MAG: tRNA (N(6)-L-threonylcarbamoyladenosine(37)-C(2))-methylthiotransferase MtaB [Lachnobacterium sp.]|nr:tRNA (N(6)-L-threonylcarbamoyladenosine(37)-C(2))-methylthiotransferase MtaB [Lachnobacterium sp.]
MKKAALHNLGCKVNAYETEAMQQLLEEAGYEIVSFHEKADVYVINTCSVTNMADRKSRQMLHRAKKMNPDAAVVAAGCYVQTKEEEAKQDLAIDILIGNNQKNELVHRLDEFFAEREEANAENAQKESDTNHQNKVEAVVDINHEPQCFEEMSLTKTAEHTRAFVKVQDGCNQFCSYCIIPYARGRVRSRNIESVLKEIRGLAKMGYQEVALAGIHLSSYGVDCEESLLHLIQEIHKIDGIRRIRLGSLEPQIVTEEFARELSSLEKICPHFHLSLQSGCDATLKRMNRKYTAAQYEKGCRLLRKYFTHPAITTDVIVGFPGETEEEFETTKAFLEKIHFYEMHIFKYSKRQGTRAAVMENQVPEEIKTKRSAELIALSERMSNEFRSYYLGREEEVLFEEPAEINGKTMYVGYTKEYVKVATESDESLENVMRRGRIDYALTDEIYYME